MNFIKHLLFGLLFGILFIVATSFLLGWFPLSIKNLYFICAILLIYPLLPDTDHRNSIISFIFIGLGIAGIGIGYYLDYNILTISSLVLLSLTYLAWILGHRQFVHSITFGIIVSFPLGYFLSYQFGLLGFICFYSHLFVDKEYLKLW